MPHKFSVAVCKEHGMDISRQRARKFIADYLTQYDKVYAFAGDVYEEIKRIGGRNADMSRVDYFLNEQFPGQNRSVPDPYTQPKEEYEHVFQLIDSTCDLIIERYK